jgi:hypothetical protein
MIRPRRLGQRERHHRGWGADQLRDGVVGVPGEPDPDRVGDAVDGDVGDAGQGLGDQLAVRAAVVRIGTEDRPDVLGLADGQGRPGWGTGRVAV